MFNNRIWGIFLVAFLLVSAAFAQEKPVSAPQVATIVNGKATHLVQPPYPPAAKAVHAEGTVKVQVLIDENGSVISASAVSGHPLLRAAAVQAARASTFTQTTLEGKPVKVSGVIVYNFVGEGLNTIQLGFALSTAAFSSKLGGEFPVYPILNALPVDWIEERKQANGLIYKQSQEEYEARKDVPNETQQKVRSNSVRTIVITAGPVVDDSEFKKISRETIANNLTELLKNRYAGNENQIWPFELGLALGKMQAQIDDDTKLRLNLSDLNRIAATASDTISADLLSDIKDLAAIGEKNQIDAADKLQIEAFFKRLRLK